MIQDSELLDEDSDSLDNYDLSKSVRDKYQEKYQALKGKIPVTIKTQEGEKNVILHTIKAKAIIDNNKQLKLDLISDLLPGEYEVTIIIEEPCH